MMFQRQADGVEEDADSDALHEHAASDQLSQILSHSSNGQDQLDETLIFQSKQSQFMFHVSYLSLYVPFIGCFWSWCYNF